jgi:GNAT superfamily N-acetyltransferase
MAREIRLLQHVPEADQARFAWKPDVFAVAKFQYHWRAKDWSVIVYEDGEAISQVKILKHTAIVNREPVIVGGIGSVVTVPEKQGQGYARLALQHAVEFMHTDLQVQFGLLFCLPRMVPFYEQLGWQVVADNVIIDQPEAAVASALPVMVLPCQDLPWPEGTVELGSLPW